MDAESLEQAKLIYETGRLLHARFLHRYSAASAYLDSKSLAHALTAAQVNMLVAIRDHDGTTIKKLAKTLDVSAPSASAMVDRLVEVGVVTREQNPKDRREVVVRVSPQAAQLADKIEEQILQGIVEMIEKVGAEYARKWTEVYEKIREVLAEEQLEAASDGDEEGTPV